MPDECPGGACLVIRKFHDLDKDGVRDPAEPMLEGISFVITVGDREVRASTDARGVLRMCFPRPVMVHIVEDTRSSGGLWYPTTPERESYQLACGDNELWIGNAQVGAPRTGTRGAKARWQAGGGPHDYH